ncbi:hypothetical protein KAI58_00530 [Candidatus Gracilibacteria bacterium]|nr:hypothetical protein [Candidatus Gracilibacteria bacterium]
MRKIYIGFSVFTFLLGVIIAFENISIPAMGMMIFFDTINGSLFFPLVFIMMVGFVSGVFLGLAIVTKSNKGEGSDNFDL